MPTRFLLSHNYNLAAAEVPPLSPDEFVAAFATAADTWQVRPVTHPHWRCEVMAADNPQEVGPALARALATYRQQNLGRELDYTVMALGGVKATPATSADTNALQQGDWGVDMVETPAADPFLEALGWQQLIAGRPETEIFQAIV